MKISTSSSPSAINSSEGEVFVSGIRNCSTFVRSSVSLESICDFRVTAMSKRRELEQLSHLIDQAFQKAIVSDETTLVYLLSMASLEVSQAVERLSRNNPEESSDPEKPN